MQIAIIQTEAADFELIFVLLKTFGHNCTLEYRMTHCLLGPLKSLLTGLSNSSGLLGARGELITTYYGASLGPVVVEQTIAVLCACAKVPAEPQSGQIT